MSCFSKKSLLFWLLLLPLFLSAENIIIGRVTWVKDGDSFIMRSNGLTYEIRMYGIDAPEYKQTGGKNALKCLIKLIKNKLVKVNKIDQDHYGRLIGKVFVGKNYINLEMVKRGQAHWYSKYAPKDKDLRDAELQARKHNLGLWSQRTVIVPSIWRKNH